jgi:D-3-phosphoglycerate dehydrogenase
MNPNQHVSPRKILLIDAPHPWLLEKLEQLGYSCHPYYQTPRAELMRLLPGFFGMVLRSRVKIDAEFLDAAAGLAFIAREGVGLEHIDVACAERLGIQVIASPEGSSDTVAEHAIGMLLVLLNRLHRADRQVRDGHWEREGNRASELKGKTVGILGYGNMGAALAQRLSCFQARVIAHDKYRRDYGDAHAEDVSLETLWRESDILSIHIPYDAANRYFVNGAFLDRFHKPVYLINTARGGVLHTADLVERLRSGKVLGAALDVLEYEEHSFNRLAIDQLPEPFQYLRQAENVLLTPHIAGWSYESKLGHARVLAAKIERLFPSREE